MILRLSIALVCLLGASALALPSLAFATGAKARARPECNPEHCRASWALDAGTTRVVRSPKKLAAGMRLSFSVYANGKAVHEVANDGERVTLMNKNVLAVVRSPGDAPLVAHLANFSDHPVRVTVVYWQTRPGS